MAGTLAASSFSISSGATVSGAATFTGNLTNNGTLNVGGTGVAGKVTITGNYTQGSSGALDIEIGGLTAGTQYDQLAISGTATLAGTLNLSLINGFAPSAGNSFQIITFTSETGTFGTVNGETQGARTLTPAYNSANVTINVTMAEPVQAKDDLREEVVPEEALALLWHQPPMGELGILGESDIDVLLGVGNEGERQVRRMGWGDEGEGERAVALLDAPGETASESERVSMALAASLVGLALMPLSSQLRKEAASDKKRHWRE